MSRKVCIQNEKARWSMGKRKRSSLIKFFNENPITFVTGAFDCVSEKAETKWAWYWNFFFIMDLLFAMCCISYTVVKHKNLKILDDLNNSLLHNGELKPGWRIVGRVVYYNPNRFFPILVTLEVSVKLL